MPPEIPTELPMDSAESPVATALPVVVVEPAAPLAPVQPDERIHLIDVLRGLALLGIITANMRGFAGPLQAYFAPELFWKTRLDFWVQAFVDTFIQGKFITIFAFLFGVGFAVQFTRAEKRQPRFVRTYVRRLLALLLIGGLHQLLFWWGDVLVSYALGGFLLILFRKRSQKAILLWALSLMLLPAAGASGYAIFRQLRPTSPQKVEENKKKAAQNKVEREAEFQKTVAVYSHGTYLEILKARSAELLRENASQPGVVIYTLPLFLLGLWVWRRGLFQDPEANRALLKRGLLIGAVVGIPANVAFVWGARLTAGQPQGDAPSPFMIMGIVLAIFGRPLLSMGYACAVGLLYLNGTWRRVILPAGAIGRTALSNYLLQTIVCTTIFYGYGGALFGKFNLLWLFVLSIVIYALQIPLSQAWLARFRFGPAEWAWRGMTYGKLPAMKRDAAAAV